MIEETREIVVSKCRLGVSAYHACVFLCSASVGATRVEMIRLHFDCWIIPAPCISPLRELSLPVTGRRSFFFFSVCDIAPPPGECSEPPTLGTTVLAYQFLLTLSITQVACERCFSTLKFVKNRLRSSLSQDNLEAVMLMCTEKEILMSISNDKVIDKVAETSALLRRLLML